MQTVDTCGQPCPAPLIAARRTFRDTTVGDSFQLITDSRNAFNNISSFLKDNKIDFSSQEVNGKWTFTITKTS